MASNPLCVPWKGPFGGVPPFDVEKTSLQLAPALEEGMKDYLSEIDVIAGDTTPATFQNTIAALERAGRGLSRARTVYGIFTSSMKDDVVQKVEADMEPKLAELSDRVAQNSKLFARIASVFATRESSGLTPEEQRLTWLTHTNLVLAGAQLDAESKKRLVDINQELAGLFTRFSQNLLADEEEGHVLFSSAAELDGLAADMVAAAAAAAEARGSPGKFLIANTRSVVEPVLSACTNRTTRESVWRMFISRGDNNDAHDNKAIITRIMQLRAERARLLGFPTHAHWRLVNSMARTPERAMELMESVWTPTVKAVKEDVAAMQAIADADAAKAGQAAAPRIEPWDYRYFAERVRADRFNMDADELKAYLQLDRLRDGMFATAKELFGLTFTLLPAGQVPVFHPDVTVWEVTDKSGHVGLWYFDPYARAGKTSGAWMSEYRTQELFEPTAAPVAVSPIVSNNANFVRGKPGEPLLISWDDAVTLFHEFGHALHGLLSRTHYPSLAGTNVARDYVEFPSQLFENFLSRESTLLKYAVHHQTGEALPAALVAKLQHSRKFNKAFSTCEYLSAALVDLKLHLAATETGAIDITAFERDTLAALGMPAEIVMRHRPTQFAHIFSGDGYSAGYYSYLWADTLSADAWEAFGQGDDAAVADRLLQHVFSTGNIRDPADNYRSFRGRDPAISALMKKLGLAN